LEKTAKIETMFACIGKFFSEAKNEIRHVNWPTRQEAIATHPHRHRDRHWPRGIFGRLSIIFFRI
jgi:hypothetical protein